MKVILENPIIKSSKSVESRKTPNSNIIGNYKLDKNIGEGAFGQVKLGYSLLTNEKVAIKILEKSKILDNYDLERVNREIRFLKKFNHENIIKLYEIIENSKNYYFIMEYASKGELFNYIINKKKLDYNEASFFFVQIINGLEYIHKNNIVHRDLKPENLLLNEIKRLKIIDFGLSNQYKSGKLLQTACGSPCYAAPEMILGRKYNGLPVDLWSVGIILFAMVCGYLPFEDSDTQSLYKKILECKLEFPNLLNENVKNIIRRILVINPLQRIKLEEIKAHSFYINGERLLKKDKLNNDHTLNNLVLNKMESLGFNKNTILEQIELNKHNEITTVFNLLLNKYRTLNLGESKIINENQENSSKIGLKPSENKIVNRNKSNLFSNSNDRARIKKIIRESNSPKMFEYNPLLIKTKLNIFSNNNENNNIEDRGKDTTNLFKKSIKTPKFDIVKPKYLKKRMIDTSLSYDCNLDTSVNSAKVSFSKGVKNPIINLELSNIIEKLRSSENFQKEKFPNEVKKDLIYKFTSKTNLESLKNLSNMSIPYKNKKIDSVLEMDIINEENSKYSLTNSKKNYDTGRINNTGLFKESNNVVFFNPSKSNKIRTCSLGEFKINLKNSLKASTPMSHRGTITYNVPEFSSNYSNDNNTFFSNKSRSKEVSTPSNQMSGNKTCKNIFHATKSIPNTTKNKTAINVGYKLSSNKTPFKNLNSNIVNSKLSNKLIFQNALTNRSNNSSSKSPILIDKFSLENVISSIKNKILEKSSHKKMTGDKTDKFIKKEGICDNKNKVIKTRNHRQNSNLNSYINEEFSTFIRATNQNILDKMQSFSLANNILMKEVSLNKFECKKSHNYLIVEFINTEINNKKHMKIKLRGNETETQKMMKDLLNKIGYSK